MSAEKLRSAQIRLLPDFLTKTFLRAIMKTG